ncbi:lactonase family protein [Paraburkholderia jirisanensis]
MRLKLAGALSFAVMLAACGSDDNHNPTPATPTPPAAAAAQLLFAQTNDATNQLIVFTRNPDGTLASRGDIPTGGKGTNGVNFFAGNTVSPDALTSNNSVIVTPDKTRLFVANAGDATVSTFALAANGTLTLLAVSPTNGVLPTSLAFQNGVLYVTHQKGAQELGAFRVDATSGKLTQIGQSTVVQQDALPTEVSISPDGKFVVVNGFLKTVTPTQPANQLLAFPINADGTLGTVVTSASAGVGPFGGRFGNGALSSTYFVTEAAGTTASSYAFASNGAFSVVSGPVSVTGQTAPCWVVITPDNRFAYVSSGSGVVSLFTVDTSGHLTLANVTAATEAATQPAASSSSFANDSWISPDGKFLYQDYAGDDKIVAYSIGSNGALTKLGEQPADTVSKISLQGLTGI